MGADEPTKEVVTNAIGHQSWRSLPRLRPARPHQHGAQTQPGLRAKDVIDVQIVIAKLDTERIVPALAGLGFEQRTNAMEPPGSRPSRWSEAPEGPGIDERATLELRAVRSGSFVTAEPCFS